ncbi:putative quinol monooxygenase [Flavobacterium sp. HJJ]|uniref:putative quinol monooxygenase n=1 Tax=Flavobacterium sp. HJJ TaxID=2783792 RepID=UPI00188C044A|nr:putative quinol monooxygenase [Flavobacterium sp. HJJ]MBF4473154.1 antibiotic biosynthesis monooxygenase [Flavobacterium sp. HJJ]
MEINLTVIIKSKSEKREELKTILLNLVENSRKEAACLQYDLHQNIENPNVFIFHEIWENKEGLDLHMKQLYFVKFSEVSDLYLDGEMTVYSTSKLV